MAIDIKGRAKAIEQNGITKYKIGKLATISPFQVYKAWTRILTLRFCI